MFEKSIDRRHFLGASLALGGPLVGGLQAAAINPVAPAVAELPRFRPACLFLTWQQDPTTTMTIQWVGTEKEAATRPIEYTRSGGAHWSQGQYVSKKFPMTDKLIFRCELTGLAPGAEYVFRLGQEPEEYRFRTAPAKATNTLQFVSGGDAGVGDATTETNRLAAAQDPLFVVIGGDIAYENGRSPGTFFQFLENYSRDLRGPKNRLVPLLGCLGNHEVNGGYRRGRDAAPFFYSIFDGLFTEHGFASLDFGDYLSLLFLDTEHTTPIEGEQTDWLEKTLKPRETLPNVFVYNHVPAYPSVRPMAYRNGEAGTGSGNRKHWCPLFERYNVDAVFEHHDHAYKRSHPLTDGHYDPKGVLYLGDGSWGKIRRPDTPQQRPYLAVTDQAYHMSVHRIEGNKRFHVALSDHGKLVDVCVTSKRAHSGPQASARSPRAGS